MARKPKPDHIDAERAGISRYFSGAVDRESHGKVPAQRAEVGHRAAAVKERVLGMGHAMLDPRRATVRWRTKAKHAPCAGRSEVKDAGKESAGAVVLTRRCGSSEMRAHHQTGDTPYAQTLGS